MLLLFHVPVAPALYSLSLHDALPISFESPVIRTPLPEKLLMMKPVTKEARMSSELARTSPTTSSPPSSPASSSTASRSEEHTSELQSPCNLVCRLLLEKKNKKTDYRH